MTRANSALAAGARLAPCLVLLALLVADLRIEALSWEPHRVGPDSRSIALIMVWVSAAAMVGFIMRRRRILGVSGRLIVIGLALGSGASLLGDQPLRSCAIGLGFIVVVLATTATIRATSLDTTILTLMLGLALLCGTALVLAIGGVESAWEHVSPDRLRGLTAEPNALGQFGGLLAVLAVGMWIERKLRWLPATLTIAVGIAAAALSLTRTIAPALVVTLLGLGLLTRPRATLKIALAATVVGTVGLLVLGTSTITDAIDRGQPTEELSTLGNRFDLWEVSVDEIVDRPLVGHGFASGPARFERALDEGRLEWIYSPSSHNLVLEIAREIGIPGLILIGLGAIAGVSLQGFVRPALVIYLATTAWLMPTTGVPGLLVIAWTVATVGPVDAWSAQLEPDP